MKNRESVLVVKPVKQKPSQKRKSKSETETGQ